MKKSKLKVKELDDSQLVQLLKSNNSEVYQEIINRYQKKLFSYIYRLVRNREETEDLLQNVFLKVYRHYEDFDVKRKFSSWIYRIAHNEAVNFLKRRSKKIFISWEDMTLSKDKMDAERGGENPIDPWLVKEIKTEVRKAINKMPNKYREVLELRYFHEKSYREISKILGKPINTVGTIINRAKKKLLETMTPISKL